MEPELLISLLQKTVLLGLAETYLISQQIITFQAAVAAGMVAVPDLAVVVDHRILVE